MEWQEVKSSKKRRKEAREATKNAKKNKNEGGIDSSTGEFNSTETEEAVSDLPSETVAPPGIEPVDNDIGNLNDSISIPDDRARHVYIRCLAEDPLALRKINSFTKTDFLESKIGKFQNNFICLPSGPILLECDNVNQVKTLLNLKTFIDIPISVEINRNVGTVQGVVIDPSLCDVPIERVLEKLKEQNVIHVRRVYSGESRSRTNLVVLTFNSDSLPPDIQFGRDVKKALPYKYNVIQCTKCWWFGHWEAKCGRGIQICKACSRRGLYHNGDTCFSDSETPINCSNCSGDHAADDKSCPAWIKQLEVAKIRTQKQINYKQALEIFKRNRNREAQKASRLLKKNQNSGDNPTKRYTPLSPTSTYRDAVNIGRNPAPNSGTRNRNPSNQNPKIILQNRYQNLDTSIAESSDCGPSRSMGPPSFYRPFGSRWSSSKNGYTKHKNIPKGPIKSRRPGPYMDNDRKQDYYTSSEDELVDYLSAGGWPSESESDFNLAPGPSGHGRSIKTVGAQSQNRDNENMEADEEEILPSQIIPRGKIPVPLRTPRIPPILKNNKLTKTISLDTIFPNPIVEVHKPVMKEVGVQTINFANKGVQTEPFYLLQGVLDVLLNIPKFLSVAEGNDFEVDHKKLTKLINDIFMLNLTSNCIKDGLCK